MKPIGRFSATATRFATGLELNAEVAPEVAGVVNAFAVGRRANGLAPGGLAAGWLAAAWLGAGGDAARARA